MCICKIYILEVIKMADIIKKKNRAFHDIRIGENDLVLDGDYMDIHLADDRHIRCTVQESDDDFMNKPVEDNHCEDTYSEVKIPKMDPREEARLREVAAAMSDMEASVSIKEFSTDVIIKELSARLDEWMSLREVISNTADRLR